MKTMTKCIFIILFTTTTQVWADLYTGNASIEFYGSAKVHKIKGNVTSETITANLSDVAEQNIEIEVKVQNMKTGLNKRDSEMYHSFDHLSYPNIKGILKNINLNDLRDTKKIHPTTLEITIKNITREVPCSIDNIHLTDESVEFNLNFELSNKNFNLIFPSFLFIKVSDKVNVISHLKLDKNA